MAVYIHRETRFNRCLDVLMICVEHGGDFFITYVGAHDDCNRWIENNRRFEVALDETTGDYDSPNENYKAGPQTPEPDEEPDYDDILKQKIDDPMLRRIFCGLCDRST